MGENMYCETQKSSSDAYRDNYDKINWNKSSEETEREGDEVIRRVAVEEENRGS